MRDEIWFMGLLLLTLVGLAGLLLLAWAAIDPAGFELLPALLLGRWQGVL